MSAATSLTAHDATTLSLLFDPEPTGAPSTVEISPALPADPHHDAALLAALQARERAAVALAAAPATAAAALPLLDALLAAHPRYASGYNNRAQLRRLLAHPPAAVVADLEAALALAAPGGPVSALQARVASLAWTQLGAVRLAEGRDEDAWRAFSEGARYGGEVAARMAVKLNPVARLCGAIVREAMKKEMAAGSEAGC